MQRIVIERMTNAIVIIDGRGEENNTTREGRIVDSSDVLYYFSPLSLSLSFSL
jgi:hypothetical protein